MLIKSYTRLPKVRFLTQLSKMASNMSVKQSFDYFLVLDFEATCDDKKRMLPQVKVFLLLCIINFNFFFVHKGNY